VVLVEEIADSDMRAMAVAAAETANAAGWEKPAGCSIGENCDAKRTALSISFRCY
jgi:hypothetical protein